MLFWLLRAVAFSVILTVGYTAPAFAEPQSEGPGRTTDPGADYVFTTLYSSINGSTENLRTEGRPHRAPERSAYPDNGNVPEGPSLSERRRLPWEERVPWWREEAIERGPLAPYDQESTFERSLEAGRAYPESAGRYRKSPGSTGAAIGQSSSVVGGVSGSINAVIAAALWRGAGSQVEARPKSAPKPMAIPAPGPAILYKGVTLIGSRYSDVSNEAFFETAKKAIDMALALPDDLRKYASLIETLIYDPPSPRRRAKGAIVDIDGVYSITDVRKKAPVVLYKDMRYSSPLRVSMSLVGGGVMAARHSRLIELLEQQKESAEGIIDLSDSDSRQQQNAISQRLAAINATDPGLINEAKCALQIILLEADKAFGVSQKEIGKRLRLLDQRRCR